MRTLLLTLAFIAAATPALATCTPLTPTGDRATDLANAQALPLCLAAELHARTAHQAQQLQFQADLQAPAISLNIYAPTTGDPALRPCEMPVDKVTAFVLGAERE